MSSKYLVVSADGHAGPPAHVYRDYLDPSFRVAFDAHQEALEAGRMTNAAFVADPDGSQEELVQRHDS